MGVTTLGATLNTPIGGEIVVKGITPNTATTTQPTMTMVSRTLIPKGTYTVTVVPNGSTSNGSSPGSGYVELSNSLEWTVLTSYADNGRVGPFLHSSSQTNNPLGNLLVLNKDAYVQIGIRNATSYALFQCDVVFTPTLSPFKSLGTITGNRTSVGDLNSTDSSTVNFGTAQLGWDYDRNAPMLITSGDSGTTNSSCTRSQSFWLWRYNSNGTWSYTYWNGVSAATGNSWYNGNGIGYRGSANNYRQSGFFIKNNFLHNVDMSGLMTNTASGLRWGWIKGDISAGTTTGSTLTMSPGHTNTAFATTSSNVGATSDNIMLYFFDKVNNKVIYNGAKSANFNGTYYPWIHHWAQWDIQTDTVDYSNSNGDKDPRIAGSNSYLAYEYTVPDGTTGNSYAIGDNGGNYYLARWNRSGTYTGVGNYQNRYPYGGGNNLSTYALSEYTQYNRITYLPNGVMVTGAGANGSGVSIDHTDTSISSPVFTADRFNLLSGGTWGMNSNLGANGSRYQVLVMRDTIVIMQTGYMKYSSNSANIVYRTAPITIFTAPATATNLGAITPNAGGIGTASTTNLAGNSGINNGV